MAGARLHSLQALQDLRASLVDFRLGATEALESAESDLGRLGEWLEQQKKHWHHQAQLRSEEVIRAKRDLDERKHGSKDHRGTTEQELALRKARHRLA